MKFIKRAAAAVVLSAGLVFGGSAIAAAAVDVPVAAVSVDVASAVAPVVHLAEVAPAADSPPVAFTVPSLADIIGLVITVGLPLLVGIITRREFQHKALVLLGLTAVNGFFVEFLNTITAGGTYDVGRGLLNFVLSFGGAILIYYGFLKPEGIAAKAQALGPQ